LNSNSQRTHGRQIEKVLTDLQNWGKRPATLIRHLAVLKATFNRAIRLGLVSNNPTRRVKTQKPNNMLVRYLTDAQEAILLNHMPPHYHGIMLTALNTGLRQGELLRLTWADIDWNVGVLTVNETKAGERRRVPMKGIRPNRRGADLYPLGTLPSESI
jgi:integrase